MIKNFKGEKGRITRERKTLSPEDPEASVTRYGKLTVKGLWLPGAKKNSPPNAPEKLK